MTALTISRLTDEVCASPQLAAEDIKTVAAAGFRSIVNNRPDLEGGPAQPTSAAIEAEAKAAGLAYAYLPVHPAIQSAEEAAALGRLVATLPKPILLFCRSGTRSTKLFNASQAL